MTLVALAICLTYASVMAQDKPQVNSTPLELSLIKTADATTLEGFVLAGGSFFRTIQVNHVAVLIRHPKANFLFDTGLGTQVEHQFEEMPWWAKPFFRFEHHSPVLEQFRKSDFSPENINFIVLSHLHWDHASGISDFPQAEIWTTPRELEHALGESAKPPAFLGNQYRDKPVLWKKLAFEKKEYRSFDLSMDVFGDGAVVLVPLPGHTRGGIGMFVNLDEQNSYFFVGDSLWRRDEIPLGTEKAFPARLLVDADRETTLDTIQKLRKLWEETPTIRIVPSHDTSAQETIPIYPEFQRSQRK